MYSVHFLSKERKVFYRTSVTQSVPTLFRQQRKSPYVAGVKAMALRVKFRDVRLDYELASIRGQG